nr:hypothetical protein [uncultured Pedobacter sp.]
MELRKVTSVGIVKEIGSLFERLRTMYGKTSSPLLLNDAPDMPQRHLYFDSTKKNT